MARGSTPPRATIKYVTNMEVTKLTTTAPNVTVADVLRTIGKCLTVIALYALQRMAEGLCWAQRFMHRACQWLNSRHNFADKEEPVLMTGWQYIGFAMLAFVVSMVLSIRW